MQVRNSSRTHLGIILAAGVTATMLAALPAQALHVAAKEYPIAPVRVSVALTSPVMVADDPITAPRVDPANPTAEAPTATEPSADVTAPETDQYPPIPPGPPRPVTAPPPRGPMAVQGPKAGAAPRPGVRPGVARRGVYPRVAYRPLAARAPVARAPIARVPAVAPRLPRAGSGGLLDQQSGPASLMIWALAGLLLGGVVLGEAGVLAVRRQR